jgi:hypothetical protein
MAEELWSVRLPTGDIRRGTLDELDAAFEAGHIDANALVLGPNATEWERLGALAGLDGDAPAQTAAPSVAPPAAPYVAPNSIRPMTTDLDYMEVDHVRGQSKAGIVIGLLAIAAIGAGGTIFAISKLGAPSPDSLPVAAALAAPSPAPTPVTTDSTPPPAPRLTEEQKQTVLANDAKRQKLQDDKKKARDEAAAKAAARVYRKGPQIEFGPKGKGGACGCHHGDPLCTCN